MSVPANIEARLKLRQLALAIAIHDLGSLRKASKTLSITQPAATSALRELEFALGAPLFERSKSGMEPTMFGRLLVERSRLILDNIRKTAQEIRQLKDGDGGEVRVGTLPASALTIVPQAIAISRAQRPKVVLHLVEGSTGQLLPALDRGDIDLVVGRIPLTQVGNGFRYEVLAAEPNVVVCRAGHPLSRKRNVTLRDLADQDWILPEEGSHVRSEFREAFIKAGLKPPEPSLVTSSTTVRVALLSTTNMLGVLTQRAARIKEKQGVIKALKVSINARVAPIILVTRTDAMLTPATSSFTEFLRQAAESANFEAVVP